LKKGRRQRAEGRRKKGTNLAPCGQKNKNILCEMRSTIKDTSLFKPPPFMGEVSLLPSASCLLPFFFDF